MPIKRHLYAHNWEDLSERLRFERAGNRCEWCGAENRKPNPVTKKRVCLTVAHIDRNPANNDESNLVALCNKCHLDYDRPDNICRRHLNKQAKSPQLPLFDLKPHVKWTKRITKPRRHGNP